MKKGYGNSRGKEEDGSLCWGRKVSKWPKKKTGASTELIPIEQKKGRREL